MLVLGGKKKHKCICKQEYIVDWILRINARIEKVSTFSLSQFSLLPLLFVLGNFFSSYHICLPLLFNSKNYRFCYFETRLYVPAWFSFVHIHSQERLAAVAVLKISDFLNDIFSRETYSLKTTCFVAQYLNYLSTRLKSNCLLVFNQNVEKVFTTMSGGGTTLSNLLAGICKRYSRSGYILTCK